jgi:hypothetical protein
MLSEVEQILFCIKDEWHGILTLPKLHQDLITKKQTNGFPFLLQ